MADLSKTGRMQTLGQTGRNKTLSNSGRFNNLGATARLKALRGPNPIYLPGEHVYLQRDVQGFAKGAACKIISIHTEGSGRTHRYLVLVGEFKVWAYESDLRASKPPDPAVIDLHKPSSPNT